MKELLTKKYAGLPGWAWLLIGVAGVGAGYLLIRWQQSKSSSTPSALTTQNSADLTTGNASGNETNSATGTVGDNGVIDNPFPETNVNGQQVPIVPPGYQAVYDSNGNIIGWEPIPVNPTPSQPTQPTQPTGSKPPTSGPIPAPVQLHPLAPRSVHPAPWPAATSTLSGIAKANGDSLQQVETLNPWIYRQRHSWNLIYPSDSIEV